MQIPLILLLLLSNFGIWSKSIGNLENDRAPNLWSFSFFYYFSIGVEKLIFEMWKFLYLSPCILMRWERISTWKIKKVSLSGHFWLKFEHFPPFDDHSVTLADLGENDQFWGQNDHLMILFWFFKLIFVLSASKYIGYDTKIVTFRFDFFRLSFHFFKL